MRIFERSTDKKAQKKKAEAFFFLDHEGDLNAVSVPPEDLCRLSAFP